MRIPFVGWVSQLPVVGVSIERKVSQMNTMVGPSRVSGVSVYGDFSARWLPVSEALLFAESRPVSLMLGRMRDGYLGREVVTVADLRRWVQS